MDDQDSAKFLVHFPLHFLHFLHTSHVGLVKESVRKFCSILRQAFAGQ